MNDGGSAFPIVAPGGYSVCQYEAGMSLRDYFAANERSEPADWDIKHAAEFIGVSLGQYDYFVHWPLVLSKWRYLMADAMLKASESA